MRLENSGNLKCRPCLASLDLADKEKRKAEAEAQKVKLMSGIPMAFRLTVREKLPNPEKLDAAMRWNYGAKGLLLCGPTGAGKSRIMWEVAKREILTGRKVKNLNAYELIRYPSLFMSGDNAAVAFSDSMVAVDLLILDDIFKAKLTERIEELLFSVIDERGAWERPCLISVNDTGDTLKERLSSDRGPALIRRLREYCVPLQF